MMRKVHFMCRSWGQSQDMGLGSLSPCWDRLSYRKTGWSKVLYTNDADQVTCKRCIAVLAKQVERLLTCQHRGEGGSTVAVDIEGAVCTQCSATAKYGLALS